MPLKVQQLPKKSNFMQGPQFTLLLCLKKNLFFYGQKTKSRIHTFLLLAIEQSTIAAFQNQFPIFTQITKLPD